MDKKKLIQIVIIIAAFGGSGVVLYNGFFNHPNLPPNPLLLVSNQNGTAGAADGSGSSVLLPDGSAMDFSVLNKQNLQFGAVSYPVLNTSTDVGIYNPVTKQYTQPLVK